MLDWNVEARGRHLYTRLYMVGMWLKRDKKAFEGEQRTLDKAEKLQRKGNAAPTRLTRARTRIRSTTFAGMPVWTASPRRGSAGVRVLYLHGGGYVHPLTPDYWRLVRALVRAPAEVIVPAYPLAPTSSIDDVLPRLVDLARARNAPRLPTVLMGDSAGGAMVLSIARQLVDETDIDVAGVVCLSPWLDARLEEADVADLESSDPMLAESGLRAAGRAWAGVRSTTDPFVSPIGIDLDGLPPIDVYIGDKDILRPAVDSLADRARTSDTDVHVHEWPSMFHVWMTRAIPEARATRRRLGQLLAHRGRAG